MKAYPSNERIWLTGKDDETYNSSNIKWFLWRPKWSVPEESRHKYDKGQLIVNFHNSGAYSYDVQKMAFNEMAKRAYEYDSNNQMMSTGEWYNNKLSEHVSDSKRLYDGNLYVDKLSFNS